MDIRASLTRLVEAEAWRRLAQIFRSLVCGERSSGWAWDWPEPGTAELLKGATLDEARPSNSRAPSPWGRRSRRWSPGFLAERSSELVGDVDQPGCRAGVLGGYPPSQLG